MIRHYYYNQQLKKFIIGFANVFTGLRVRTGMDGSGNISEIEVPIRYGTSDRVTASIAAANTQNKLFSLPIMSCYMSNLELAPDRMHGVNQVDRRTYLEQGGVYPDDIKAVQRVMAIPYNMMMDLSIYASNTDQMYQILEQVLMLFDYDLQIQFNDAPFDWTKITKVTLNGMNNEETYPAGTERRMVIWTLNFIVPVWLSPPMDVRNDLIQSIMLRFGDMNDYSLNEIDDEGNLTPFLNPLSETVVSSESSVDAASPGGLEPQLSEHFDASKEPCSTDDPSLHQD